MSTTYLTIYDLLRITYTYEARALADSNEGCPQSHHSSAITLPSSCVVCSIPIYGPQLAFVYLVLRLHNVLY